MPTGAADMAVRPPPDVRGCSHLEAQMSGGCEGPQLPQTLRPRPRVSREDRPPREVGGRPQAVTLPQQSL